MFRVSFKTGKDPKTDSEPDHSQEDEPEDEEGSDSESESDSSVEELKVDPPKPSPKEKKKAGKPVKGVAPKQNLSNLIDDEAEELAAGDNESADTKVSGTFKRVRTPSLPLCLQRAPSSLDEPCEPSERDSDSHSVCDSSFSFFTNSLHELEREEANAESESENQSFADLLQLIADHADVKAEPKAVFKSAQFVHLASENYEPPPDSLALTTTRSIPQFLLAWWREFAHKDMGGTESRALKFGHLFRSRSNVPSLRPYTPADDTVAPEALNDPPNCYKWLHQPPHRMDITTTDAKQFETVSRRCLNVANFMEAVLQALQRCGQPQKSAILLRALTPALKAIIQLQASSVCQWVQARRDHWLARASNITTRDVQVLRHAPIVGVANLFPSTVMDQVDDAANKSMQFSAFYSMAKNNGQSNKSKSEQQNKYGTVFAIPDLARDPYVVRTGYSVVDHQVSVLHKNLLGDGLERAIANTPASEVGRASLAPRRAYKDLDDLPLATERQQQDWSVAYEALVYKARAQHEWPVGGRLVHFVDEWRSIGCSRRVLRWLAKGYRLPFVHAGQAQALACRRRTCPQQLRIHYSDPVKSQALNELIRTLLDKHVIEEIPINANVVHCLLFLRPKPNGKWRAITDVSPLNELLKVKKFKMDTPQVIRQALTTDLWATSVDFSDAYHHIPIHPKHRQFLAFQVGQRKFWYRASPFGLAPLPQVFTEIFAAVKAFVRERYNVMVFQYLDDWLLLSRDRQHLADASLKFVRLCIDLGIVVNMEKSELVPTQRLVHLGIEWNFATCIVRPPQEKITKLRHTLALIIKARKARLPMLESVRGQLCSLEKTVPYGRIHFRFFQALVTKQLRRGRNPRWVELTDDALSDLWWWAHEDNLAKGSPFRPPPPDIIVTSDASTHGWGASFEGQTIAGRWRDIHASRHINWLEMEAVRLTVEGQARKWKNKSVRFLIDNRTTVAYIMKQGGTSSAEMTALTRRLLQLTCQWHIHLDAHHLAGEKNVVADLLSRRDQICKNEWRLDAATFQWVQRHSPFGPATVDLFANQLNHQLPRYGSPHHDVNALLVDSLHSLWPRAETLYAFPPANILTQVLDKIREECEVHVLLIAPTTPTTTWFPTLKRVATSCEPLPSTLQLQQPHCDITHPDASSMRLAMWAVSGRDF